MVDSTRQRPNHEPFGPKAPPDRRGGTSPGCLAALVIVIVLVLGFIGFVAWNAIFIAGYMSDDPSLHQDWSWTSTLVTPPLPSVGTPQLTPHGNRVTLYEIQNPMPLDSATFPPPSGGVARLFAAADVEVCASGAPMTEVSQRLFVFRSPGPGPDRKVESVKEPAFPQTPVDVPLGSCVRGWITFAADEAGGAILAQYADGETFLAWETATGD